MAGRDTDLVRLIGDPKTCLVRERSGEKGVFDILSPAIGLFDLPPAVGTFVRPASHVGYLTVLRRYYHLVVPEGHHGVVTQVHVSVRKQRVEFGEPLFTVSPEAASGALAFEKAESAAAGQDAGVPEGMFAVKSPTDGIFYRRANPQSPAYVEEGAVVEHGAVLGLVEVMKCFNPIVYAGEPEVPARGRIARIIANDTTEVKHGAVLFLVEPAQ
jgi:acetyl-CoA carboxylase biotin carboxyl carrier protein